MKTLSYILADDDPVYRELTHLQLQQMPHVVCKGICKNAFEASAALQENLPDLLLLDVEMPGLSGIQLAKGLAQLPLIIFISSHTKYAADAFEVDAIDYLVKPVAPERLLRAVGKARMLLEMKGTIAISEGFQPAPDHSFYIKEKNSFVRILYQDVLYIDSLGDFVNIFLAQGDKKIALVSLKNMEQQLPSSQFIRISRTQLVNKQKITAIDPAQVQLGRITLHIGKTYSDNVLPSVLANTAIKRFL